MKRQPLLTLVMFCVLAALPAAGAPAEINPLTGNDRYLPPYPAAGETGLHSLYVNPGGLGMRPGELGLLYFQGLRGGTDVPDLEDEFGRPFTGEWSLVAGGGLAFGLDRSDGVSGYHFDLGEGSTDPAYSRFWRFNLGCGKRIDIPAWDMQLGVGAAYRWTSSAAYALHRLQTWDLGVLLRWGRWASAGVAARNLNRPALRGLAPGETGEVAPRYQFSVALRPRVDWATFAADIHQFEDGDAYRYDSEFSLLLAPRGRFDIRFAFTDDQRYSAGLWYSQGGMRSGGHLGNRDGESEGTRRGALSVELRNRWFGKPLREKRHYLELELAGQIQEAPPGGFRLGDAPLCTRDVLDVLTRARSEPDIAGILLRLDRPKMGMAQIEEIHEALAAYRRVTGKPVIVYADAYDTESYYLASACSRIVINPAGELWLSGVRFDKPFVKGALDKLGVEPQFRTHGRYKSAVETFTREGRGADARAADSTLLRNRYSAMKRDISAGRNIDILTLDGLFDRAHFDPAQADGANLVDDILYSDQLPELLAERGGSEATLPVAELRARRYTRRAWGSDPGVALIYLTGNIVRGDGDVAGALREARRDPRIVGVVLRVDSGGGGSLASEIIQRELLLTRLAKPVIVSMGNAGASGAYLIGIEGTQILADRLTVTGSIGVVGGKFHVTGLLEKLGISIDGMSRGLHAGVNSPLTPYSAEELDQLQVRLDRHYDSFVEQVATRRRISRQEVDLLGQGRVWSGEDAIGHGLIDGIGGLNEAMHAVRRAADITPGREIEVIVLPRRRGLFASLMVGGSRAASGPAVDARLADWLAAGLDPFAGESVLYLEPRLASLRLPVLP